MRNAHLSLDLAPEEYSRYSNGVSRIHVFFTEGIEGNTEATFSAGNLTVSFESYNELQKFLNELKIVAEEALEESLEESLA
jgi:hypothetical protein